ncbi:STAS domain-containing protein [bacterium]|nr:STAS domain-containing protein [bacterium]
MQGIKVGIQEVGAQLDIVLLSISGYVDTTTCQELTQLIQGLIKDQHIQIITDLGGVTYISSAGWGVFMGEIKGLREMGGDIKVVHMNPEVFEVFEMLEFNRILNYYDSVEEAINEFDLIRGIDITQSSEQPPESRQTIVSPDGSTKTKVSTGKPQVPVSFSNEQMAVQDFPLVEKIKLVILENPFLNIFEIRNTLKSEKYGEVKIGFWKLLALLRSLSLDTKAKRYRYYRSR